MSNPDLQWELLRWIRDQRIDAEETALTKPKGQLREIHNGRAQAFLECFAKVEEMIDIARERENGLG